MRIWNNDVSAEKTPLKQTNVAEGGDYQLVGTDDPNIAASNFQSDGITPGAPGILAASGSTYRRTQGGPPFFYVKETPANESAGWVGK
jgi:hypothetical protein